VKEKGEKCLLSGCWVKQRHVFFYFNLYSKEGKKQYPEKNEFSLSITSISCSPISLFPSLSLSLSLSLSPSLPLSFILSELCIQFVVLRRLFCLSLCILISLESSLPKIVMRRRKNMQQMKRKRERFLEDDEKSILITKVRKTIL